MDLETFARAQVVPNCSTEPGKGKLTSDFDDLKKWVGGASGSSIYLWRHTEEYEPHLKETFFIF
jgi:hypothetical protein